MVEGKVMMTMWLTLTLRDASKVILRSDQLASVQPLVLIEQLETPKSEISLANGQVFKVMEKPEEIFGQLQSVLNSQTILGR